MDVGEIFWARPEPARQLNLTANCLRVVASCDRPIRLRLPVKYSQEGLLPDERLSRKERNVASSSHWTKIMQSSNSAGLPICIKLGSFAGTVACSVSRIRAHPARFCCQLQIVGRYSVIVSVKIYGASSTFAAKRSGYALGRTSTYRTVQSPHHSSHLPLGDLWPLKVVGKRSFVPLVDNPCRHVGFDTHRGGSTAIAKNRVLSPLGSFCNRRLRLQ